MLITNDKDYDLWLLLGHTRDAIHKARQKELNKYDIFARQSAVLLSIQIIGDKATPAEISRLLLREPHGISEFLARMEKAGLVRKVKDLKRKNQVRVVVTKKGHDAYRQASKRESIHRIMSVLSEEEQQKLTSYLKKLLSGALKELGIEDETRSLS